MKYIKQRFLFVFLFLFCACTLPAQTANDFSTVVPYSAPYAYGSNLGYYGGHFVDQDIAQLAYRSGARSIRPSLPDWLITGYGTNSRLTAFQAYQQMGMIDLTAFVGDPNTVSGTPDNRETTVFPNCPERAKTFKGMYEPIWLDANKTQINTANTLANYIYKTVNAYGPYVKFYEIVNEPDFTYGSLGWDSGNPNYWGNVNPLPSDLPNLYAPVQYYIRMMRVCYDVIKKQSPNSYVCTGGIGYPSFLSAVMRNTDNPVDGSVTAAYPLKGGAYFDVLSYHYYPTYSTCPWWDNATSQMICRRHSDGMASVAKEYFDQYKAILNTYNYNGVTYPEKKFIVTEFDLGRATVDGQWGAQDAANYFIIKANVLQQQLGILQSYKYGLGEGADGVNVFNVMGVYGNLTAPNTTVANATINQQFYAVKTESSLLYGKTYDAARTTQMNLPSTVGGGAFKAADGTFTYVLWAKTTTDLSETASASYTFPIAIATPSLRAEWNYAQTYTSAYASSTVALTGAPSFFVTPGVGAVLPFVADAGPDKTIQLPTSTVTLNGGGAGNGRVMRIFSWTKLSGGAATITSPSAASTTITGLVQGTYQFQLTVTDDRGATASDIVTVTVNPANEKIYASIRHSSPAASVPWNNITGVATSNLLNSNSQATAVDLEFLTTTGWHTYFNGPQTGNNSGVYPDAVLKDYYYFGFYDSPEETVSFRYKDLVPGQKYNLTLYAGSVFNMAGVTDNGTTVYTINGVSKSLYVQNNTANTVTFTNVVADASGYITVAMSKASGTPVGYINAAVLEKVNVAPAANAGSNQTIQLPTSSVTLTGTGTDTDGSIAFYSWAKLSGGSAIITSASSASTTVTGLAQGTYLFTLTVTDNQGATATATVQVTVNAAAQRILVDVGSSSLTSSPDANGNYWNNMTDATAGVRVTNAKTTTNVTTTVNLEVVNRIDGTFNPGGNGLNNLTTGLAVNDYPVSASADYAFADPSATNGQWKLTGLDNTKQYTVKFWGTKTDTYNSTRIIQIKRSTESTWQEYDAADNIDYNRAAVFTFSGVTEMSFDIRVKAGDQFGYISVVDISSVTPSGRPAVNNSIAKAEEEIKNTVMVYPNPVKNSFTLDINNRELGKTQVTIFNAAMQVVKKISLNKTTTVFKNSISVPELGKGIYFVEVKTATSSSTVKILKQ